MIGLTTGEAVWTSAVSEVGDVEKRDVPAVVAGMNRTTEKAIEDLLTPTPACADTPADPTAPRATRFRKATIRVAKGLSFAIQLTDHRPGSLSFFLSLRMVSQLPITQRVGHFRSKAQTTRIEITNICSTPTAASKKEFTK